MSNTMQLAWLNAKTAQAWHGKGTQREYLAGSMRLAHKGYNLSPAPAHQGGRCWTHKLHYRTGLWCPARHNLRCIMDCTIDINPLFYSPHDMAGFITALYTHGLKFEAELISTHCLRFTITGY